MSAIRFPAEPTPARHNHPDKPEMGEDEEYLDYLVRTAGWPTENPPSAPHGFELIECSAEPRHFPIYMPVDDDLYPGHCLFCERDDLSRQIREHKCRENHRRWKSWRIWWHIAGRLYTLGITASGGGVSYGHCEFCGIGRQHHAPRWRGKRSYILGKRREFWACLRRGHIFREHIGCGLCSVCAPCPDCGSTDPTHYSCEVAE